MPPVKDDLGAAGGDAADDFEESDMEEEDIDDELMLPNVLKEISFDGKRELLRFKRTHNEIEWEQEVLRRQDLLARKIDMERLKLMTMGAVEKDTKKKKSAAAAAAEKRKVGSKRKRGGEYDSEEESEDESAADDDEDGGGGDEEEEDDDEEEDFAALRKSNRPQRASNKSAAAGGKKARRAADSDDDEGGDAGDAGDADDASDAADADAGVADRRDPEEEDDDDDGAADDFDDDDEDDLFNSDEEEAITKGDVTRPAASGAADDESEDAAEDKPQRRGGRSTRSSRSRRRKQQVLESDEEYGDDGVSDDSENDDDDDSEDDYDDDEEEEDGGGRGGGRRGRSSARKGAAARKDSKWERARAEGDEDDDPFAASAAIDASGFSISSAKSSAAIRRARAKEAVAAAEEERELNEDEEVADDDGTPATREDYHKIQARRDFIMRMIREPHAKRALCGWFVRVPVGQLDINDLQVFRIAEIADVRFGGRRYAVPDSKEQIDARLVCTFLGKRVISNLKIMYVSNTRFSSEEFRYLEEASEKTNQKIMTKRQVAARRERLLRNAQHTYTNEEIKQLVAKRVGLDKSKTTEYTTAMQLLEKKLEAARVRARDAPNGDEVFNELEAIQKTIDRLRADYAKQKEIFDRAARKQLEVNRRMRESNVQRDIAAGMRKRQEEQAAAARGEALNKMADPFIRRETRPKILWNTGKKLEEQRKAATAEDGKADANNGSDAVGSANSAAIKQQHQQQLQQQQQQLRPLTTKALQPAWRLVEDLTVIDEIRKRIRKQMGVDPYAVATISKRDRYLEKVCAGLPPVGSEERRLLHRQMVGNNYKTLEEVVSMIE